MIKNTINKIKEALKNNIKSFPITNICVFIITIITILNIDIDFDYRTIERICMFFGCFGVGAYFIETKKVSKVYYAIPLIIATFFLGCTIVPLETKMETFISKLFVTYLTITGIYSLYNNYKNSKKQFSEYLEDIFKGFMKLSFTYGILALSILIICLIFESLIMDISKFDIIAKLEIFILGVYYISNILYVLKGEDNTNSIVIKSLIRKVLNPLVYISIAIIYMFVFKIIINGEVPDIDVFYIISFLFAIDVPILLMSSSYKENKAIDKINKYSSFILIPFIVVQIYALLTEISCYGIIPETYMGIMIVVFEIFYLVYSILKKDHGKLFIVAIIMTIVAIIAPFVNSEDLSLYSQYNNLKIYKDNSTYTVEQKTKIFNAYKYIRRSEVKDEYFAKLNISEKDIEAIKNFEDMEEYDRNDYDYMGASYNGPINIEGYTNLYKIGVHEYSVEKDYIDEIEIKYNNNKSKFRFYTQYMRYYRNKENIRNYFQQNNEIILDENHKLVITSFSVSYTNDKITSYSIDGYLLTK